MLTWTVALFVTSCLASVFIAIHFHCYFAKNCQSFTALSVFFFFFFSLPVYCFLVMIIVFALFDCCLLDYCFCSCGLVGLITYLCLPCLPYQLCLCLIYCICLLRDNKPPTFGFYLVSMSSPSGWVISCSLQTRNLSFIGVQPLTYYETHPTL